VRPLLPALRQVPKSKVVQGRDDAGPYTHTVFDGYEQEISCLGRINRTPEAVGMLKAALVNGPKDSIHRAVVRLAAHKHLSSNEGHMALLMRDYTDDLARLPEFVVHAVCDWYRTESAVKFMPTLAELLQTCRRLEQALRDELRRQMTPEPVKPALPTKPQHVPDRSKGSRERLAAWMALSRARALTQDELAAWDRGEMPAQA
jgi:hypothetical protein